MWVKRPHLAILEVVDTLISAHLATQKSWLPSALNVVKDPVMNVARDLVVDVVVKDVAIEEAAGGLLEPLAELISSMPSLELWLHMSINGTMTREQHSHC
jgi:hypothetical protein